MTFTHFSILTFLGALGIFIYGIRLARQGIQLLAGDRLRVILARLTDNRFKAVGIGALVTLILQSSNATTISLVGFAATGSMTLMQAMGVMLGADLGSTLVVILLSIQKLGQYSLLLIIFGVLFDLVRKGRRARYFSTILVGLGFIFFGMKMMALSTQPLQSEPWLKETLTFLSHRPLISFTAIMIFTVLVQNSAAPIGLIIALSFAGLIDLSMAVPMVLGANLGTCFGSIFASLGSNTSGKQVAIAHLSLKAIAVTLAFILMDPFIASIQYFAKLLELSLPIGGQIAMAHVMFNLYLVVLFFPFLRPAAWLLNKILPIPPVSAEEKFRPLYLDEKSLEFPSLAFANVRREILRMLDLTQEMFGETLKVLAKNDRILMEEVYSQDDQVDLLDKAIKMYLAKLSQENLTENQAEMELRLIEMTSILEEIGDVINRNILELADKKIRKARRFSDEGWEELQQIHQKVMENFQLTAASVASEDPTLAKKVLRHHDQLSHLEREGRLGHLMRLHQGLRDTVESSSIHMDLLSNFYRVDHLLASLVKKAYPHLG